MIKPELYRGNFYKFCSLSTLSKIVQNQTLRFSRCDDLNDLYELSPFLAPLNWDEIVTLPRKGGNAIVNIAFQRIFSSLYITCFSKYFKTPHSHLMWAHYGDSHKGCCFEFDFSDEGVLQHHQFYPVSVVYTDCLLTERNKRTDASEDLPLYLAIYKSKVWEYEQEVRLVLEADSLDHESFKDVDPSSKKIDVNFQPRFITKVVFGARTSVEDIVNVMTLFARCGLEPKFTKMDIDPLTLEFVEKSDHLDGLFQSITETFNTGRLK